MMHILNMVVARLEKLDTAIPVVCKDSDLILEEHLSYLEDRGWHCVQLTDIDREFLTLIEAESLSQSGRKVLVSIGNRSEKDLVFLAEYWDRGNRELVSAINLLAELGIDRKDFKKDFLVALVRYGLEKPESFWQELKAKGLEAINRKVVGDIWELLSDSGYADGMSDAEKTFVFTHFANVTFGLALTASSSPDEAATRISEKILEASFRNNPDNDRYDFYREWEDSSTYAESILLHAQRFAQSRREEMISHIDLFEKDYNHPFVNIEQGLFDRRIDDLLQGENPHQAIAFAQERARKRKRTQADHEAGIDWHMLADLEPLLDDPDLSAIHSLESFLALYQDALWQYDALDRKLRKAYLPDRLMVWAKEKIARVQKMVSNHWTTYYDTSCPSQQGGLLQRIFQTEEKTAVIVVDAFRYELAYALKLKTQATIVNHPMLALTPTETAVGMAALFSSGEIKKTMKENKVFLIDQKTGRRLDSVAAREENLKSLIAGVQISKMETPLPDAPKIVIMAREIDTMGHDDLIEFFDVFLNKLSGLADKLLMAGYKVHFTSDHGFYLPLSGELDKKDGGGSYASGVRYSLNSAKPAEGVHETIDTTYIQYADSGSVFKNLGGHFWHGGITYQEVIIPHLQITPVVGERRWGVKIANKDRLKILQNDRVDLLLYAQKALFGSAPRVFVQYRSERIDMDEPLRDQETIPLKIDAKSGESFRIEVRDAQDGTLLDWVECQFLPSRERLF